MYPLLLKELVENHAWLSKGELMDLFAFAQMTPGPVATNAATYVGYKLGGIPGAFSATVGVSLPSAIVMLLLIRLVMSKGKLPAVSGILGGLRPTVVALILATAVIIVGGTAGNILTYSFVAVSFLGSRYFNVHPVLLIVASGLLGIALL